MAKSRIQVIFDDKELQDLLKKNIDKFDKKTKKDILRKGARIVAGQLRKDTPVDSGVLRSTITELTWSRSPDYFASFKKKKISSSKGNESDPYYAAFLNEGWVHHFIPYKGAVKPTSTRQGVRAMRIYQHKRFIQKATATASPAVIDKIDREVKRLIEK